ncbi:MAG: 3-hydroxyacyl-CoA dehydrogenase NAD-binding domain-containing protein, partial [Ferrovibrio sp.]
MIKTIGVIGAGQMGNGIAHVCALAGYDVVLQDMRLYGKLLSGDEAFNLARGSRIESLVAKPAAERTDGEKNELFD